MASDSIGLIVGEFRETISEILRDGSAVGLHQRQVLATATQTKTSVRLLGGLTPVFSRCEYNKVLAGFDDRAAESPFREVLSIVRQKPAIKFCGFVAAVSDFDPVREFAVAVLDGRIVPCLKFGDEGFGG